MPRPFASRPRFRLDRLPGRDVPSATDLGAATDFNAFLFDDLMVSNSDIEGRVAVGDHATLQNYGLGTKLPSSAGTRDDLNTGGDLDFTNGQVYFGNIVHGGAGDLKSVGTPNGTVRQQAGVLDFAAIEQDLTAKSAAWGDLAATGTTKFRYGRLMVRGTDPALNVFTVTSGQLVSANSLTITAPAGATVLLNVPGAHPEGHHFGLRLRGPDAGHILWNFPDAESVEFSGVGLKGSMLAPAAAFAFNNGEIHGTVIADSFTGTGELHIARSQIDIEPQVLGSLRGLVFLDLDQNGVLDVTDEVYDGAEVHLTGTNALGQSIDLVRESGPDGRFFYGDLAAGDYRLHVTPPQKYESNPKPGIPGTIAGTAVGTAVLNGIDDIALGAGADGINFLLVLGPTFD
jgi:choice-of-anchor A domain-containing protein